jgi:hypothetical protein
MAVVAEPVEVANEVRRCSTTVVVAVEVGSDNGLPLASADTANGGAVMARVSKLKFCNCGFLN